MRAARLAAPSAGDPRDYGDDARFFFSKTSEVAETVLGAINAYLALDVVAVDAFFTSADDKYGLPPPELEWRDAGSTHVHVRLARASAGAAQGHPRGDRRPAQSAYIEAITHIPVNFTRPEEVQALGDVRPAPRERPAPRPPSQRRPLGR